MVTRNTGAGSSRCRDRNEDNSKPLARNHRRASLVPAAAVIPAPRAYVKVVAVKKLVVGLRREARSVPPGNPRGNRTGGPLARRASARFLETPRRRPSGRRRFRRRFAIEQIGVFKAGVRASNAEARDDGRRPRSQLRPSGAAVMIDRGGRGLAYSAVRGEILGPVEDERARRHPTRTLSLIKNESGGIEDDQIPS